MVRRPLQFGQCSRSGSFIGFGGSGFRLIGGAMTYRFRDVTLGFHPRAILPDDAGGADVSRRRRCYRPVKRGLRFSL